MVPYREKNGKLYRLIFRRYIRKNGKVIYPVRAKAFPIWIEVDTIA